MLADSELFVCLYSLDCPPKERSSAVIVVSQKTYGIYPQGASKQTAETGRRHKEFIVLHIPDKLHFITTEY